MKVIELAFVGYPITDLKRARQFYEQTLGLKVSHLFGDEKAAWVEYDIAGGTLAIANMSPDWKPARGGVTAGLEVEDFQAAIETLKKASTPFLVEAFETPVCHMAVVADPDGNSITIHKRKS
jgi:predicted enzyme related to lactoylglutathione lyase